MNIKNRFAIMAGICALVSFTQNASAQNAPANISSFDENQKNFESYSDDFIENLMDEIPYSESLKYSWEVADGDVDLYFEDLRADRGNKGISYKIDSLPMIGEMNGSEFRADLGEDSKLTFKSDYMPFVGRVDGFQFKATTGTEDSSISFRYKIDLTW